MEYILELMVLLKILQIIRLTHVKMVFIVERMELLQV